MSVEEDSRYKQLIGWLDEKKSQWEVEKPSIDLEAFDTFAKANLTTAILDSKDFKTFMRHVEVCYGLGLGEELSQNWIPPAVSMVYLL